MTVRVGVVTFPGSLDDRDAGPRRARGPAASRCRSGTATATCAGVDAVILPGGFSYGDYLRCGAIARFAPVMAELCPRPGPACRCSASATASRSSARRTCCPAR